MPTKLKSLKKMETRNLITLILKIVVAIATAILGVLGANALASCSVNHAIDATGRAVIVTTDTTVINHDGYLKTK